MDILKKMFQNDKSTANNNNSNNNHENDSSASATVNDEFRKPQWFEESETDDELFDDDRKFAFQVFTNPLELQKHFERQIMEAMRQFNNDGFGFEKDLKEEFLKPGFESKILKEFEKHAKVQLDTDLDGEIYPDQLHSIIQRLTPSKYTEKEELPTILPGNERHSKLGKLRQNKPRLTDEERIMGKIHGTLQDDDYVTRTRGQRGNPDMMSPVTPNIPRGVAPFGGVFEGTYQGPKMFSQSGMIMTVRKPDGSYETTKIMKDATGKTVTTVTRTHEGKTETFTTYDGKEGHGSFIQKPDGQEPEVRVYSDRNILVTKEGYAMPRNLW